MPNEFHSDKTVTPRYFASSVVRGHRDQIGHGAGRTRSRRASLPCRAAPSFFFFYTLLLFDRCPSLSPSPPSLSCACANRLRCCCQRCCRGAEPARAATRPHALRRRPPWPRGHEPSRRVPLHPARRLASPPWPPRRLACAATRRRLATGPPPPHRRTHEVRLVPLDLPTLASPLTGLAAGENAAAMAAARTSTPSRRPSSSRPPPTLKSA